jgi:hypothetical protein
LDAEYRSPDIRVYIIRRRGSTPVMTCHIEPPLGAPATLVPADDTIKAALAQAPIIPRITSLKRTPSIEQRKKPPIEDTPASLF